jgi:bacterioferritin-associated ferredoxin
MTYIQGITRREPSPFVMIVCSCNVFSDRDVRSALDTSPARPATANQVYGCLGCSPQCGRCARTIRRIMDEALGAAAAESCASECPAACGHLDHGAG